MSHLIVVFMMLKYHNPILVVNRIIIKNLNVIFNEKSKNNIDNFLLISFIIFHVLIAQYFFCILSSGAFLRQILYQNRILSITYIIKHVLIHFSLILMKNDFIFNKK